MSNDNIEKPKISDLLKAPFEAKDIEWRVQTCGKKKDGTSYAQVLAYISARAVQDRLDNVVGAGRWKNEVVLNDKGCLSIISIKIEGEWVSKSDGADFTDVEAFKGGISGAFKRAAVLWGIGRYLYDLEATFVNVLDSKPQGAKHGEFNYLNDKKKEVTGFWKPPELPAWALPKK